jgi:hypothetical protein
MRREAQGSRYRQAGEKDAPFRWEHDSGDLFIPLDAMRAGCASRNLHVRVMGASTGPLRIPRIQS